MIRPTAKNVSTTLATAALGGMLAASSAALVGCQQNSAGTPAASDQTGTIHSCKGQNACKAQGNCSTGDQGCKGKNSCKGRGGCKAS